MSDPQKAQRYDSLDGLRTIACFGVILMHIAANNQYGISGLLYQKVIPSFTDFVYLFMVLSAFGMCCGYYQKVLSGKLDLVAFYKKRYLKILPFFALLVALDLLAGFSKEALIEAAADLSLTFGLFPNHISVIGVGWFLGLVFAFYLIFPFYCVLLSTKPRAWFFFAVSLVLNHICRTYFGIGRENIVYSFCYFMAGGLIFLYAEQLRRIPWFVSAGMLLASIFAYYLIGKYTVCILAVNVCFVLFAIGSGGRILSNRFTRFISSISLEMYLSHMFLFQIVKRLHLNTGFGSGVPQYLITCLLVIGLDMLFALAAQKAITLCLTRLQNRAAH